MRRTTIIGTALAAAAVLAAGPGAAASEHGKKERALHCTLEMVAQGPPQGTPPGGTHFGFASCPRPFGPGVHHNTYTVAPNRPTQATITSSFTNYYDRGTASGTASLTFDPTTNPNITYTGTVTYTGGTGRFRHVRGSGTIVCTTTDGGAHKSCTVNSTLTGV